MGKLLIGVLLPGEEMGFYQKEIAGEFVMVDEPTDAAIFEDLPAAEKALAYLEENYEADFAVMCLSVKMVQVKERTHATPKDVAEVIRELPMISELPDEQKLA